MKRTFLGALLVGGLLGYALLSGAAIDLNPTPTGDPPRTHDVQVRAIGEGTTPVSVTLLRNGNTVLERDLAANESFARVLRLQGSGEFTLVVSTSGDSTTVTVDRPERYRHCTGDIDVRFSVETEDVYVSTQEKPGRCIEP
ncbi:hypothetical protein G9C85_01380 [Halorubellus sp. JP-L1]|uniref:hypothetical protein n=1 Tax=Halorubellus sp. JP-L1 TaxID=2715753 RepID=UPI00140C1F8D|nr:hypothetical protein [Halorubellus sp. JP-L1]NHN40287.1 hypothetical protein [Halorubellus sp. JP-L1]